MSQAHPSQPGHEAGDVRVRPLLVSLALLAAGCTGALLLMRWTFDLFEAAARAKDRPGHPLAEEHQRPPGPRLQADPQAENAAWEAQQREALTSYGWLDRDGGLVRLPVERALELVLQEGLPARKEGASGR
jgi:hypothetical protein